MTLATIILLGISWTSSSFGLADGMALRPGQAATSPGAPAAQDSGSGQQPSATQPKAATPTSPATAPKPRRKKKTTAGCSASTTSAGGPSSEGTTSQNSSTTKDCPPAKIIVRQGGTSEPAIQLAGGEGTGQASQQRANANQLLETTEANLKKIAGRQLSSTEQDTVVQIRQYMEQSKAAVAADDMERARTLAWKAQTLSEDLVNPQK